MIIIFIQESPGRLKYLLNKPVCHISKGSVL